MKVFDKNGNGYPDKNEPRLYDTGEGSEVGALLAMIPVAYLPTALERCLTPAYGG